MADVFSFCVVDVSGVLERAAYSCLDFYNLTARSTLSQFASLFIAHTHDDPHPKSQCPQAQSTHKHTRQKLSSSIVPPLSHLSSRSS